MLQSPVEAARDSLDERELEQAWETGRAFDLAEALAFARGEDGPGLP